MNFPEKLKSFQEQFEKRLVSDLPINGTPLSFARGNEL